MMPIAAVPEYLGTDFSEASPGLRFGMYLCLWDNDPNNKRTALAKAAKLTDRDRNTLQALLARQKCGFERVIASGGLQLEALATAPFTTGLGNEHPLENGFAFLNPYGLPYLPGSGVKGVLRQAARELASDAWGECCGWDADQRYPLMQGDGDKRKPVHDRERQPVALSMLDVLFGRETADGDTDHVRGALTFWDVIPQIPGETLAVEIMTPHQSHYYQQKKEFKAGGSSTPHDSGQPNPISFLTVPPGSGFVFHVVCDTAHLARLAPELEQADAAGVPRWKTLLEAAFDHAFAWLGFGAKTAVGYGTMGEDHEAKQRREAAAQAAADERRAEQAARERAAALERMSPVERAMREFLDDRPDKNQPELSALLGALKQNRWQGEIKVAIAREAEKRMREEKRWRETSSKKNPAKDHDHQNTLLVMKWVKGE